MADPEGLSLHDKLQSAHERSCPWIHSSCPDTFMYYPEKSSLQIRQEFADRLFACLSVLVNLSIGSKEGSLIDMVISKVRNIQVLLPPLFNNTSPMTPSETLTLSFSPPPITPETLHTTLHSYTPPIPTTEAASQTVHNKAFNQFTSFLPSSSTQVASVTSLSTFLETLHTHLLLEQASSTDTATATADLSLYIHIAALLAIYGWSSPSAHNDGDNSKSTTTATRYSTDGDASSKSQVNTHNNTSTSTTLACDICGRCVDLSYFNHAINALNSTSTSPASIKHFDPTQQHRSYCPYIHSHRIPTTDTGTNTGLKMSGSEVILDELSDKFLAMGGHTSVLSAGKDIIASATSSSSLIGSQGSNSTGNGDGEVGERSYARIKEILRHIIV